MEIRIQIIKLGKLYLAATSLGGITLKGRSASEPGDAVRNLCWKLAGRDEDDDARVAVELAVQGTTLNAQLEPEPAQIGDGAS